MSTFSQRPTNIAEFTARPGSRRRNGYPAAARKRSLDEPTGRLRAGPESWQESSDDRDWDQRVADEERHQEVIEASFDRAEAYGRLGDFEQALEWLDRAAALCGEVPSAYRAQRARWARASALRPRPAGRGPRPLAEPLAQR
jgi:tetratricopeptide (TPR) repeat protein